MLHAKQEIIIRLLLASGYPNTKLTDRQLKNKIEEYSKTADMILFFNGELTDIEKTIEETCSQFLRYQDEHNGILVMLKDAVENFTSMTIYSGDETEWITIF